MVFYDNNDEEFDEIMGEIAGKPQVAGAAGKISVEKVQLLPNEKLVGLKVHLAKATAAIAGRNQIGQIAFTFAAPNNTETVCKSESFKLNKCTYFEVNNEYYFIRDPNPYNINYLMAFGILGALLGISFIFNCTVCWRNLLSKLCFKIATGLT